MTTMMMMIMRMCAKSCYRPRLFAKRGELDVEVKIIKFSHSYENS